MEVETARSTAPATSEVIQIKPRVGSTKLVLQAQGASAAREPRRPAEETGSNTAVRQAVDETVEAERRDAPLPTLENDTWPTVGKAPGSTGEAAPSNEAASASVERKAVQDKTASGDLSTAILLGAITLIGLLCLVALLLTSRAGSRR